MCGHLSCKLIALDANESTHTSCTPVRCICCVKKEETRRCIWTSMQPYMHTIQQGYTHPPNIYSWGVSGVYPSSRFPEMREYMLSVVLMPVVAAHETFFMSFISFVSCTEPHLLLPLHLHSDYWSCWSISLGSVWSSLEDLCVISQSKCLISQVLVTLQITLQKWGPRASVSSEVSIINWQRFKKSELILEPPCVSLPCLFCRYSENVLY